MIPLEEIDHKKRADNWKKVAEYWKEASVAWENVSTAWRDATFAARSVKWWFLLSGVMLGVWVTIIGHALL